MNTPGTVHALCRIIYRILMVSSVADARVRWDKDTAYSTLTKALDECEKLKLRIEVCSF
jgi:hypothetical protein